MAPGIGMYKGSIYAEINDRIVRYALPPSRFVVPKGAPETIVSGLPLGGDHPMHPFIIGCRWIHVCGRCYRDQLLPAEEPAAQHTRRRTRAPNLRLVAASGVMTPTKPNQVFSPQSVTRREYATGKALPSTPAGDSLSRSMDETNCTANWPDLYKPDEEATLPAEEVDAFEVRRRLWLARVLLRRRAEETRAGPGIRR